MPTAEASSRLLGENRISVHAAAAISRTSCPKTARKGWIFGADGPSLMLENAENNGGQNICTLQPGITKNPTAGVPLLEENNKMERYLTKDEAQRLYVQMQASENTMLQYIIPMLIMTGARKREALDAKWADFDLTKCLWRIPISKSGKARHVPISDGVLQLLASVREVQMTWPAAMLSCPWAFPNPQTGKPYVSFFIAWNTARTKAGLADVRIHDLRHSFASFLINNGRSLYEVQKILGHTQVRTTQRYAHLSPDTLQEAANVAVNALGDAFAPKGMRVLPAPSQALPMAA